CNVVSVSRVTVSGCILAASHTRWRSTRCRASSCLATRECSDARNRYTPAEARQDRLRNPYAQALEAMDVPLADYLLTGEFGFMGVMFFLNITAGISIISLQSPLYQDIWRFEHPTMERSALAAYGAALIAVSSLCNGFGRIFWGAASERL